MKRVTALFGDPFTPAGLFAGGLKETSITGDAVIINILTIRHVGDLGVAADAKGPGGALLDERDFDFLPLELGLTEAGSEQLGRNAAILLAKLHLDSLILAMYNTTLGPRLTGSA